MRPIAKPTHAVPASIYKRAAQVPQSYALFLFLDAIPYCELAEHDSKTFNLALASWRKGTLPTLKKSNVRYFIRGKDLAITEVAP
jgi:hypothetical protein